MHSTEYCTHDEINYGYLVLKGHNICEKELDTSYLFEAGYF